MSTEQKSYGFREVFSLMWKYKSGILLILILNILWSFFQLCFPFLTRALVDSGIQYSDMEVVMIILASQLLLESCYRLGCLVKIDGDWDGGLEVRVRRIYL